MSNVQLEMSRDIDAAGEAEQAKLQREMAERNQETMRKSGLATNGPSPEQYNYGAAEITEDPDGGYNLPNAGMKHVYPAGRDLQTGEVLQTRYDPEGLGEEGTKRFRESFYNTQNGEPADLFEATVPLYIEHRQNGGQKEDFPLPVTKETMERTHQATEQLGKLAMIESKLAATEYDETPMQVDQVESITREEFAANPANVAAAKVLAEYIAPGLFAGDATDETKLMEKAVEELSAVKSSFWKMADIILDVENGSMPQEVRDAYITLLTEHEKLPNMDADVWQGAATGLLADVPFMFATGGTSSLALKTVGKQAAIRTLIGKLMGPTAQAVGHGMAVGGLTAGMEEGLLGGGEELMMQDLSGGDRDWERVFDQAWQGTKWGVMLGVPFGGVLSQPGIEGVRFMMRNMADEFARAGVRTEMSAQRGSLGVVSESETYNGISVPQTRSDIGERFADPEMNEFYSRLQETLIGEGQPLIGKKKASVSRHKASDLLATLEKVSGNKFAGYELKESGLKAWLASQGDGTVSRDMIEDYLYANSPRTNILVSSMTDFESPGTYSYKAAQNAPEALRRGAALEVFQDRFFDVKEVMQPVDLTRATESSKAFGAQVDHNLTLLEKAAQMEADGLSYAEDLPLIDRKPRLAAEDYPNAEDHTQVLWQWADRKAKAYMAGEPFDEPVPIPEPRSEMVYQITDLRDGKVTVAPDEFAKFRHTSAAAREATGNMTNDQIIEMIDLHDRAKLLAPPRFGRYTITGGPDNQYQEIRLTLPYDGVTNKDTIAMERFGSMYKDLTHGNKTRVDRTIEYANAPTENFRDAIHFPLEHNRLATIRTQEFFTIKGDRVLAVNELQSDMEVAMRKVKKAQKEGRDTLEELDADDPAQAFFADAGGDAMPDQPMPSLQATDGWMQMSVNRIFQLADKQGYNHVAFPVDPAMIKQIQGWDDEMAEHANAKSTVKFYDTLAKYLKKDKQLAETWGIESIEMDYVGQQPGRLWTDQDMMIIKFDASKGPSQKPLYGVGAISGAQGATMLDEEDTE